MSYREAEYFADRALVELAMSGAATHPRAGAAHAKMAELYGELAAEFKAARPKLRISQR